MGHKHGVRDTNAHFTIDQFTRQIKNDSAEKTTIVQYDHNSERLTFEMPLYIDSHAMTLCDLIEIHFINISTDGKSQNPGVYEVTDIKAEGEKAIFTWLISQEATQLAGSLSFFIVFKCTENGVTVYRWGTEICKTLAISAGMDNGEAVLTEYPDILAQWKAQLFDASDTAVVNVATAEASALAAIEAAGEAKKQSVLDSIPDEYEALSALADQNHRNKAGAIVLDEEGESIVVNDASEYPLQNLRVFGRSTQDGTPTPDAPVDIVSMENPVVTVTGKNLFNINAITSSSSVANNGDNTITAKKVVSQPAQKFKEICPHLKAGDVATFSFISHAVDKTGTTQDLGFIYLTGAKVSWKNGQSKTITQEMLDGYMYFYSSKDADGNAVETVISEIQIELGEVATGYEPYIEPQTVETSHALPGIPVSSGGNYTDENGQEWICDEVDLARGVYVQRVGQITLDNNHTYYYNADTNGKEFFYTAENNNVAAWETRMHCSHFPAIGDGVGMDSDYWAQFSGSGGIRFRHKNLTSLDELSAWLINNPVNVCYVLATPIETALSDAEITAFKALHTNKPNTTILNDAGAYMAVEYVADTKTYIDNKIKEMMEEVE